MWGALLQGQRFGVIRSGQWHQPSVQEGDETQAGRIQKETHIWHMRATLQNFYEQLESTEHLPTATAHRVGRQVWQLHGVEGKGLSGQNREPRAPTHQERG